MKTLEDAKVYFVQMGCSSFHIDREDPIKRDAYRSFMISKETEAEWRKEQFDLGAKIIKSCEPNDITYYYTQLISLMTKKKDSLQTMLTLLNDLIDEIPYENIRRLLSDVIGNNGSKTHGGLIELAFKAEQKDIAYSFIEHAKTLIDLANKNKVRILSMEGYLLDILDYYGVDEDSNFKKELLENNNKGLFSYYLNGANNDNIFSMRVLSKHYYDGCGCDKNDDLALEWAKKASDRGNHLALKEYEALKRSINKNN